MSKIRNNIGFDAWLDHATFLGEPTFWGGLWKACCTCTLAV